MLMSAVLEPRLVYPLGQWQSDWDPVLVKNDRFGQQLATRDQFLDCVAINIWGRQFPRAVQENLIEAAALLKHAAMGQDYVLQQMRAALWESYAKIASIAGEDKVLFLFGFATRILNSKWFRQLQQGPSMRAIPPREVVGAILHYVGILHFDQGSVGEDSDKDQETAAMRRVLAVTKAVAQVTNTGGLKRARKEVSLSPLQRYCDVVRTYGPPGKIDEIVSQLAEAYRVAPLDQGPSLVRI